MNRFATMFLAVVTVACVGEIKGGSVAGEDRDPDAAVPPPSGPDARPGAPDAGTPDASPDANDDLPDDFLTCREPATPIQPRILHNEGQNCMDCHGPQNRPPGAPRWYAAGTAYTNGQGSAPLPGVTMSVRDATGKVVHMVTASNGNFFTPEVLEYPLSAFASSCPDIQSMGPAVPANSLGGCNSCHDGNSLGRINL